MSPPKSTSPATGRKAIEARERALKALDMRKRGDQYWQIAEALGYSNEGAAQKAVTRLLAKTEREGAEEAIEIMLQRIDRSISGIWEPVKKGQLGAIDRLVRLEEHRAKLLGLYSPQQHVVTQVEESMRRILSVARGLLSPEAFKQLAEALVEASS